MQDPAVCRPALFSPPFNHVLTLSHQTHPGWSHASALCSPRQLLSTLRLPSCDLSFCITVTFSTGSTLTPVNPLSHGSLPSTLPILSRCRRHETAAALRMGLFQQCLARVGPQWTWLSWRKQRLRRRPPHREKLAIPGTHKVRAGGYMGHLATALSSCKA